MVEISPKNLFLMDINQLWETETITSAAEAGQVSGRTETDMMSFPVKGAEIGLREADDQYRMNPCHQ